MTKLDKTTLAILRELQANARISLQDLSERVGLSSSPCARRVRMLEDENVITGYHAEVNEKKVDLGFSVFVSVKLDRQVDDALREFERAIRACPEVVEAWLMTGNRDYLLRIAVRDTEAFEHFLTGRLTKFPQVASIESSIPLRRVKSGPARIG